MDKIIGNRIVVKRDNAELIKNGIILPNTSKKYCGTIIECGDKCSILKAGDKVYFSQHAGSDYGDSMIMTEADVYAYVRDEIRKPMPNWLLVRLGRKPDEYIFKGGKLFVDHTYNPTHHASVYGVVEQMPEKIIYKLSKSGEAKGNSMQWDTDLEVEVGDTVWFSFTEVMYNLGVDFDKGNKMDDKKYFREDNGDIVMCVDYSQCFVAKRGDEIICLNGYCLIEPILEYSDSVLEDWKEPVQSKNFGYVRCKGKPVREYESKTWVDADVEVGDLVMISRGWALQLEHPLHRSFDNQTTLYKVQPRGIIASVPDEETAHSINVKQPKQRKKV